MAFEHMPDEEIIRLSRGLSSKDEVGFGTSFEDWEMAGTLAEEFLQEGINVAEETVVNRVKSYALEQAQKFGRDLPDFDTPVSPIITHKDLEEYMVPLADFERFIEDRISEKGGIVIHATKDN